MTSLFSKPVVMLGAILSVGILTTGCASKKYVNQQVSPVDQRVSDVARQTDEHGQSIENLDAKVDNSVSRLDENIRTAQRIGEDANRLAQTAGDTANSALGATRENQQAISGLETRLGSVHNFRLHSTESVHFGFDRHELNDEAMARLATLMDKVRNQAVFVVEVQGYTDKTGSNTYNLALSEKRADAVVRYLNTTHNVPLRSIHKLGVGSEDPVADNATRDGREQNRRVEVRVFVPENSGGPIVSSGPQNTGRVQTTAASYKE
jgi:OmpA-OmpF porin, OOP family